MYMQTSLFVIKETVNAQGALCEKHLTKMINGCVHKDERVSEEQMGIILKILDTDGKQLN